MSHLRGLFILVLLLAWLVPVEAAAPTPAFLLPQGEIWPNDFLISDPSCADCDANGVSVAYNNQADQYLVVWSFSQPPNNQQIWGRIVEASNATLFGDPFQISITQGYHFTPVAAYNYQANEYLVVWQGQASVDPLDTDIFGRRVSATGTPLGTEAVRYSYSDPGNAGGPGIAYNTQDNRYLITWISDVELLSSTRGVNQPVMAGGSPPNGLLSSIKIYGQLVSADGTPSGSSQIITTGSWEAYDSVTYNSQANEYLVTWVTLTGLAGEDVYGQRLAADGSLVGPTAFQISFITQSPHHTYTPQAVYNVQEDEYLVAWTGEAGSSMEISAQLVDAQGNRLGDNFQVSDMAAGGNPSPEVGFSEVAYDTQENQYLVVWNGVRDPNDTSEIYGQLLSADGTPVGEDDFRLSDMGPEGSLDYSAGWPGLAYSDLSGSYLAVWYGDDNTPPLVVEQYEVFGQLYGLRADLAVSGGEDPDPVAAGGTITYALHVANNGPDPAAGVQMDITLDSGMVYQSVDSADWLCAAEEGSVHCTGGDMASGATTVLNVLISAPTSGASCSVTAGVYAASPLDSLAANNSQTFTTTIQGGSAPTDLIIIGSDLPDPVAPGGTITYTLEVGNSGPNPADEVQLNLPLPGGAAYQSASGSDWNCGFSAGAIHCTATSVLGSGADFPLQLLVTAPLVTGTFNVTAVVSYALADTNPDNNSLPLTTYVQEEAAQADLALSGSDSPDPVAPGGTLVYSFEMSNNGPDLAVDPEMVLTLPPGAVYQSFNGAGWACSHDAATVSCSIPELASGSSTTLHLTITAPPSVDTCSASAAFLAATDDPAYANNYLTLTTAIQAGGITYRISLPLVVR